MAARSSSPCGSGPGSTTCSSLSRRGRYDTEERDTEVTEASPLLPDKAVKPSYCDAAEFFSRLPESQHGDFLVPWPPTRCPFLDITRICCVWCVAVDHGNSTFGKWNILFTQAWVLQFLFLVCGICFCMSNKSLLAYEFRLWGIFVVGVTINYLAFTAANQEDVGIFNMIFQFWFVVGLMIYAVLLAPLRICVPWLRSRGSREAASSVPEVTDPDPVAEEYQALTSLQRREQFLRVLLFLGGGFVGLYVVFKVSMRPLIAVLARSTWKISSHLGPGASFWGLPTTEQESKQFLQDQCTYLHLTCSNLYLLAVCPFLFEKKSITSWCVLANTYAHRCIFFRDDDERVFHGLDLMLIAMTCYYFGMSHRRALGEYVVRYWFVVLFICAVLWPPGTDRRFDEHPPRSTDTRVRVNLLECIFVVCWLVAGERLIQKEIFTEDRLEFLKWWALVTFMLHKAIHTLLPSPLNWITILALAPACYCWQLQPSCYQARQCFVSACWRFPSLRFIM